MTGRLLRWADAAAHILYWPTGLGRQSARFRWHHRIHLIPGRLLALVCDRYEAWLLEGSDDFYEDDEPVERVLAKFRDNPDRGVTAPPSGWRCPHMAVSSSSSLRVRFGCGCTPAPIG